MSEIAHCWLCGRPISVDAAETVIYSLCRPGINVLGTVHL
jgi:hypothetical protein